MRCAGQRGRGWGWGGRPWSTQETDGFVAYEWSIQETDGFVASIKETDN